MLNRFNFFLPMCLLCLCFACSKKGDSDTNNAGKTEPAIVQTAPAPQNPSAPKEPQGIQVTPEPTAAPVLANAGVCDKYVPQPLRDKRMPGAKIVSSESVADGSVECKFSGGTLGNDVTISVICQDAVVKPQYINTTKSEYVKAGYQPLTGIGRGALRNGDIQVVFWDDDTNCQASITWLDGKDRLVDLAKDLAAVITPALVRS